MQGSREYDRVVPELGDFRVNTKFALFPEIIYYYKSRIMENPVRVEWKWLERVYVLEQYREMWVRGNPVCGYKNVWVPMSFINKEEYRGVLDRNKDILDRFKIMYRNYKSFSVPIPPRR